MSSPPKCPGFRGVDYFTKHICLKNFVISLRTFWCSHHEPLFEKLSNKPTNKKSINWNCKAAVNNCKMEKTALLKLNAFHKINPTIRLIKN